MDSDEGKTISVEQKTEIQSDIIEQNYINLKEKYDYHDIDLYESVAPKESELMVDKYNKTPFPHIPDREVSSLNKLQQQILYQNKFNLLDKAITPKIASLKTTLGLKLSKEEYLSYIDLGAINIKKSNEVYLSEVDPYNIPEYYDVVIEKPKKLVLVGKVVDKGQVVKQQKYYKEGYAVHEMEVSGKAFENLSIGEMYDNRFGFRVNNLFCKMTRYKFIFFALMGIFIIDPFTYSIAYLWFFNWTFKMTEKYQMSEIVKIKYKMSCRAMMLNPDMIEKIK